MAFWFIPLGIAAAALGKVIYSAVTDDSSSSSSTSNYDEQKQKAEEKAQQEQAKKDKAQRKNALIQQLSKSVNTELNVIKHDYLTLPENIKFHANSVDKLNAFSQKSIIEKTSALEALAHLTDDPLVLDADLIHSANYVKLIEEHSELASLKTMLLDELKKAS